MMVTLCLDCQGVGEILVLGVYGQPDTVELCDRCGGNGEEPKEEG